MSEVSEAINMVQGLPTGGSELLEATKWVVIILIIAVSASIPFMMLMNKKTRDKNENALETAISDVGSTLYNQLSKQVEDYRAAADVASKERNDLVIRVAKLEAQIVALEPLKETVTRLRDKLDAKDVEIKGLLDQGLEERRQFMTMLSNKDGDIARRDARIAQLEKVTTALQVRLARDEALTALTTDTINPKNPEEAATLVDALIPSTGRRITDDLTESPI